MAHLNTGSVLNIEGSTASQVDMTELNLHEGDAGSFTMPVRSGDTWRVAVSGTYSSVSYTFHWLPLTP